jgi:hypothetical protein
LHTNRSWVHRPADATQIEQCRAAMIRLSEESAGGASNTLVMYHLGGVGVHDSSTVYANNVDIFISALTPTDPAFYLFNVLDGTHNPFYKQLPWHLVQSNRMCVVHWDNAVVGDITVSAITAAHLGPAIDLFSSVMYLNQVRPKL